MKTRYLFLSLLALSFLFSCKKEEPPKMEPEVRPVKTVLVTAPDVGGVRNFPAIVDAFMKAELSFRVSGKVVAILYNEGDMVHKGDVIAKLDATDYQIAVNDKKATYDRARKDYLRGKKLVENGHISRLDYDRLESVYLSSKAALNLARQQLSYTRLKAPFDGVLAKRHIQNFEEIQAKQPIVSLNDISILEVKFDVPENLLLKIRKKAGDGQTRKERIRDNVKVTAKFNIKDSREYPLEFKEIATKADSKTQTFEVTYTLKKPDNIVLLPGMTASVRLDLSGLMGVGSRNFHLPVSAVVADSELKGQVWIVDMDSMTVSPQPVKVGKMSGNRIEIIDGIKEGQRVVVAGVPFLYKGLKVSLMEPGEQARDNIQHQRPVMVSKNSGVSTGQQGDKAQ